MAKHYARLWSGNFYAEVTNDYKSTIRKEINKITTKETIREGANTDI